MIDIIQLLSDTADELIIKDSSKATHKTRTHKEYFNELRNFLDNNMYWSRYNVNNNSISKTSTSTRKEYNLISGKVLNQQHLLYDRYNVYTVAYARLLRFTEGEVCRRHMSATYLIFPSLHEFTHVRRTK